MSHRDKSLTPWIQGARERPELEALIEKAKAALDAMTPAQTREMYLAQRKSWVVGEMMLEHPDMSREEVVAIYDEITGREG